MIDKSLVFLCFDLKTFFVVLTTSAIAKASYALIKDIRSTAFVDTNAKYGIPLSRYTVFLKTVL